jgi:hypothetical protein
MSQPGLLRMHPKPKVFWLIRLPADGDRQPQGSGHERSERLHESAGITPASYSALARIRNPNPGLACRPAWSPIPPSGANTLVACPNNHRQTVWGGRSGGGSPPQRRLVAADHHHHIIVANRQETGPSHLPHRLEDGLLGPDPPVRRVSDEDPGPTSVQDIGS